MFPTEIEGCWGSRGTVRRLPDIMAYFGGATLQALGEQRLAAKRRTDAIRIIDALHDSMHETGLGESHEAAAQALR